MPGTDLEKRVGEDDEMSGLDKRLLDLVANNPKITPKELSEELSLAYMPPARCAQRVREILASQDWLSLNEQKAILFFDLIKVRDRLYERIDETETHITRNGDVIDVASSPSLFGHMIRLLKEWRNLIESMKIDIDTVKVKLRQAHASIMLGAIELMFRRYGARVREIIEAGEEFTAARERELMEEVMPIGFQYLESHSDTETLT